MLKFSALLHISNILFIVDQVNIFWLFNNWWGLGIKLSACRNLKISCKLKDGGEAETGHGVIGGGGWSLSMNEMVTNLIATRFANERCCPSTLWIDKIYDRHRVYHKSVIFIYGKWYDLLIVNKNLVLFLLRLLMVNITINYSNTIQKRTICIIFWGMYCSHSPYEFSFLPSGFLILPIKGLGSTIVPQMHYIPSVTF